MDRFEGLAREKNGVLRPAKRVSLDRARAQEKFYRLCISNQDAEIACLKEQVRAQEIVTAQKAGELEGLAARERDYQRMEAEKDDVISSLRGLEKTYITALLERDTAISSLETSHKQAKLQAETTLETSKKLVPELQHQVSHKQVNGVEDLNREKKERDIAQEIISLRGQLAVLQGSQTGILESQKTELDKVRSRLHHSEEAQHEAELIAARMLKEAQQTIDSLQEKLTAFHDESRAEQAEQEQTLDSYRTELNQVYQKSKDERTVHGTTMETMTQHLQSARKELEEMCEELQTSKEDSKVRIAHQEQALKSYRTELLGLRQDLKNQDADHVRALEASKDMVETRTVELHQMRRVLADTKADGTSVAEKSANDLQAVQEKLKAAEEKLKVKSEELDARSEDLHELRQDLANKESDHTKALEGLKEDLRTGQIALEAAYKDLEASKTECGTMSEQLHTLQLNLADAEDAYKRSLEASAKEVFIAHQSERDELGSRKASFVNELQKKLFDTKTQIAKLSKNQANHSALPSEVEKQIPAHTTADTQTQANPQGCDRCNIDGPDINIDIANAEALYQTACDKSYAARKQHIKFGELLSLCRRDQGCTAPTGYQKFNDVYEVRKEEIRVYEEAHAAVAALCKFLCGKDLSPHYKDLTFQDTYIQEVTARIEMRIGLSLGQVFTPWAGNDKTLSYTTLLLMEKALRQIKNRSSEETRLVLDAAVNSKSRARNRPPCKPLPRHFRILCEELQGGSTADIDRQESESGQITDIIP